MAFTSRSLDHSSNRLSVRTALCSAFRRHVELGLFRSFGRRSVSTIPAPLTSMLLTTRTSSQKLVRFGRRQDVRPSLFALEPPARWDTFTFVFALPIFSVSPYELALTVPGVQIVNQRGFSNGINIQVNGARRRANSFLLDGQEINDVSIDGEASQPKHPRHVRVGRGTYQLSFG